jgi:hypothetical protein
MVCISWKISEFRNCNISRPASGTSARSQQASANSNSVRSSGGARSCRGREARNWRKEVSIMHVEFAIWVHLSYPSIVTV